MYKQYSALYTVCIRQLYQNVFILSEQHYFVNASQSTK